MISPGQSRFTDEATRTERSSAAAGSDPTEAAPPHPLEPLLAHLAELREYAATYVAARADRMKLTVRTIAFWAMAGLLAGVLAMTAVVTAVVLLLVGIADGLSALLGDNAWAGYMLCGGGVMLLLAVGLMVFKRKWFQSSRRRTIQKYERRHQAQRAAYGHDVAQRARH